MEQSESVQILIQFVVRLSPKRQVQTMRRSFTCRFDRIFPDDFYTQMFEQCR